MLFERACSGESNLLVLLRLHARHTNRSDTFILIHDRNPAPDREPGGEIQEGGPFLYTLFPDLTRLLGQGGCARLAVRHFGGGRPAPSIRSSSSKAPASSTMAMETF